MPAPNPFLDRPSWAPAWTPHVEGGRALTVLRWSMGVVLAAGLASCMSRGADSPADPVLGDPTTTVAADGGAGPLPDPTSTVVTLPDGSEGDPTVSAPPEGAAGTTSTSLPSRLAAQFGTIMVELLTSTGEAVQLCLLHADTGPERGQGLMGVTDFEGYDGMLFSNPAPVDNQFFMAGTPTPLSITWWQADGTFRNATDMEPCTSADFAECERYPSNGSYVWAIEVPQGALDGRGVDEDARLSVGPESCTPDATD